MPKKPDVNWNPKKKPMLSGDISGFIDRPYPEQLALILGRTIALERAVTSHEETLGNLYVEFAEMEIDRGTADPDTTLDEVVERVLTLEARVNAIAGGLDLFAMALDREPITTGRDLEVAKIEYDLGLPGVEKGDE